MATGGTITFVKSSAPSGYDEVHTFKSSGSFSPKVALAGVRALVIGGGGQGGPSNWSDTSVSPGATGAGAGGFIDKTGISFNGGSNYTVTVGAGGSGAGTTSGAKGSNSVLNNAGTAITACGGGGGYTGGSVNHATSFVNGGSGGGSYVLNGASTQDATNCKDQGNSGGIPTQNNGWWNSPGGGGAGSEGEATNITTSSTGDGAGAGGRGKLSNITGANICYAGGGAGSKIVAGATIKEGGAYGAALADNGNSGSNSPCQGGGGANGRNSKGDGNAGADNTGGGGSAAASMGSTQYYGGAGGSGIVVIRFPYVRQISPTYIAGEIALGEEKAPLYDTIRVTQARQVADPFATAGTSATYYLYQAKSAEDLSETEWENIYIFGTLIGSKQGTANGEAIELTAKHTATTPLYYRVVALIGYQYVYYDIIDAPPHETIALKCPSCKEKEDCDQGAPEGAPI
jgi:hypothetical protein